MVKTVKLTSNQPEITPWLKPFLGVKEGFQHSFIEKHVAHGFRNDNINFLW